MTQVAERPLLKRTAAELMSRTLVLVPREMSLRGAAHLLSQAQVTGAPVVDDEGRCVGVLSATDFVHWVEHGPHELPEPIRGYCASWQMVESDALPAEAVHGYMTPDPVTVSPATPIRELARKMLDAHIHRVVVVDGQQRPVGIVSTTDILAALVQVEPASCLN